DRAPESTVAAIDITESLVAQAQEQVRLRRQLRFAFQERIELLDLLDSFNPSPFSDADASIEKIQELRPDPLRAKTFAQCLRFGPVPRVGDHLSQSPEQLEASLLIGRKIDRSAEAVLGFGEVAGFSLQPSQGHRNPPVSRLELQAKLEVPP